MPEVPTLVHTAHYIQQISINQAIQLPWLARPPVQAFHNCIAKQAVSNTCLGSLFYIRFTNGSSALGFARAAANYRIVMLLRARYCQ